VKEGLLQFGAERLALDYDRTAKVWEMASP
jgi:hypothetical protein